ncbi:MAG: transcription antitermination factor NusB [Lachnospiraceae bacterium]|nr:transcription antitermination factor NusB [Lachnospiraceae bacterium]
MKRSDIRENVFKILFRAEFNSIEEMKEQTSFYFDNELSFDSEDIELVLISDKDKEYITNRANAIIDKLEEIDKEITAKATGWEPSRMGKVELAIIRLAVFEILFDEDTPNGVAINEAVELAKKYGQDESSAFVNGVLAKFAK